MVREMRGRCRGPSGTESTPQVPFYRALLGAILLSVAIGGCGSSSSTAPATASATQTLTGNRVILVYRAHAGVESVSTASINAAIAIMRKRVAALGIPSEIQRSGANEIKVTLPDTGNLAHSGTQVGKTAQLDFYDWEPNVIGPTGKAAPNEGTVTGGPDAGAAQFGLTEYQAVLRAAKRAPIIRSNDTTLDPGCTASQIDGCRYGVWYLLDTKHEKMLRGPEESAHSFYEAGYTPPADAVVTAMHANPGTMLVQARPLENAAGKVINASPNSWYVLNDDPALTGSDLTNPQPAFEESGKPDVTFDLTAHGKTAFEQVTKEIAHRGQEAQLPGVTKEEALQHFAVVLDNQIITAPSIDFTKYPEGIDASTGSQISSGFTISSARNLANELRSGALPINLELVSRSPVQAG
jgi:SecD/SecF fusion protein